MHSHALERIADGRLPLALSTHSDAGYGAGILCDLCDQPIAAKKIAYDVIMAKRSASTSRATSHGSVSARGGCRILDRPPMQT
jgi:hypothetical protein